jgi:hypothetical protein
MLEFPQPTHVPCPDCGASVPREEVGAHECEEERRLDFVVLQLRDELEQFEDELGAWLDSPAGRFATWLAERDR